MDFYKQKIRVAILGGDSYIGRKFFEGSNSVFDMRVISRIASGIEGEVIVDPANADYFSLLEGCDVVINFFAIVHRPDADRQLYYDVNHTLAVKIADQSRRAGVSRFVQMSSVAVYGKKGAISYESECLPCDHYGKAKLLADNELLTMQTDSFKVMIIRPPMVFGSGAPGNMLRLAGLIEKYNHLPFGSIDNKRDFVFIDNLTFYIAELIVRRESGVVLISDDKPVSTTMLVKSIANLRSRKISLFSIRFLLPVLRLIKPQLVDSLFESMYIAEGRLAERFGIEEKVSFNDAIRLTVSSQA